MVMDESSLQPTLALKDEVAMFWGKQDEMLESKTELEQAQQTINRIN